MYRVSRRLAHAGAGLISTSLLLSGCVAGPTGLGANMHRSIKDPPETPAVAAAPAAPKAATKVAMKPPPIKQRPPVKSAPEAPTCATGSDCMVRLKAMIESPDRSWIGRPQPPAEYANGTRLFAYRALRAQLTCPQLTDALGEIRNAATVFAAPVAGVSPQQAKRLLTLNAGVDQELQTEFNGRCKS